MPLRRRRLIRVLLFGLTAAATLAVAAPVEASSFSWAGPALIDAQHGLPAVSCPSLALCVVADEGGNVLTAPGPTANPADWTSTAVVPTRNPPDFLEGLTCASTQLCIAVGGNNEIITSTDPTGGSGAWHRDEVSGLDNPREVACASLSLCVAVDIAGNAAVSTSPAAGATAWTVLPIDSGASNAWLSDVACPSTSFCIAVDHQGDAITSNNPTGGSAAWTRTEVDPGNQLNAIACPSTTLCVAVDGSGQVLSSTDPSGGAAAWQRFTLPGLANPNEFIGYDVACPSTSLCAIGGSQSVLVSTDPAGGASAWTLTELDPLMPLTGVSCPSTTVCVLSDEHIEPDEVGGEVVGPPKLEGRIFVGRLTEEVETEAPSPHKEEAPTGGGSTGSTATSNGGSSSSTSPPPETGGINSPPRVPTISSAQLVALLKQQLVPHGKTATIQSILKHGGVSMPFTAPEAGTLSVSWFLAPAGSTGHSAKSKPVLIASGKLTLTAAGAGQVRIGLTGAGRRRLAHVNRAALTAAITFKPQDAALSSVASRSQVVLQSR